MSGFFFNHLVALSIILLEHLKVPSFASYKKAIFFYPKSEEIPYSLTKNSLNLRVPYKQ